MQVPGWLGISHSGQVREKYQNQSAMVAAVFNRERSISTNLQGVLYILDKSFYYVNKCTCISIITVTPKLKIQDPSFRSRQDLASSLNQNTGTCSSTVCLFFFWDNSIRNLSRLHMGGWIGCRRYLKTISIDIYIDRLFWAESVAYIHTSYMPCNYLVVCRLQCMIACSLQVISQLRSPALILMGIED